MNDHPALEKLNKIFREFSIYGWNKDIIKQWFNDHFVRLNVNMSIKTDIWREQELLEKHMKHDCFKQIALMIEENRDFYTETTTNSHDVRDIHYQVIVLRSTPAVKGENTDKRFDPVEHGGKKIGFYGLEKEVERRKKAGEEVEDFADALEKSKLFLKSMSRLSSRESLEKMKLISELRGILAVTLETLAQKVGPPPDQYDGRIKNIFKSKEPADYLVARLILEECLKNKNFDALDELKKM